MGPRALRAAQSDAVLSERRPAGAEHLPSELLVVDCDDHLLDAEPVGEHRERVTDGSERGHRVGQVGDEPVGRVEQERRGRFTGG